MASEIKIDPGFFLPEGLQGVSYEEPVTEPTNPELSAPEPTDGVIDLEGDEQVEEGVYDGIDEWFDDGGDGTLATPENIVVAQQKIRVGADGASVVDIVLEFPDVPGATNYDVRIST